MTAEEKKEMEQLREQVQQLMANNANLAKALETVVERNVDLFERLDCYYQVRMRSEWMKSVMKHHREVMAHADLRDDNELLSMLEARIEGDNIPLPPEYGLKDVADLLDVTQSRIVDLFKKKTIYRTVDRYLDYLRLMRALRLLREKPGYSVEAVAMDAGFNSVRTMQRKISEAIGLTPGEFRVINNPD